LISMPKGRSKKITIMATMVMLVLAVSMLAVGLSPTAAKRVPPQTWSLRLASGYNGARQTFIKTFPEVSSSGFHYYNPGIMSQPGAPTMSLSINLESVSAKATDYVFYENWHLEARGVDVSIGVPILGLDIRVARIVCRELIADVNLWPPEDGEFGTLTATLKGEVLLAVPIVPGSPIPGYYYSGPELRLEWTFVEPRYAVTVDPSEISVPQGCRVGEAATVTVTPEEPGITGPVGYRFECREMGGINGWIDTSKMKLGINVEPWVPTGTYTANVVVTCWTTGKEYRSNDISVTVTESGFTVMVDPFNLGQIPQGESRHCNLAVIPWTDYTGGGMPLYWRPTSGDFAGIGIGMPGGIQPPWTGGLDVNVGGGVPPRVYEMDICVFDGGLNREFSCHVTFEVVPP